MTTRIALVAGEESGDILAAGLMERLRAQIPDIQFEGVGGRRMMTQGLTSEFPMERLSVMGLVEVLKRYSELSKRRRALITSWIKSPPDLFIGIDAPDFNLEIEAQLKKSGVPTAHYVSPSVWAWRSSRMKKIESAVDLMLCFLPFEANFYERTQVTARFVGHPLANRFPLDLDTELWCKHQGLDPQSPIVALLPGSRQAEIAKLGADFISTAAWLKQRRSDLQFVIPVVNRAAKQQISALLADSDPQLGIKVIEESSAEALSVCDATLIASGTATLEAMLAGKPMVVAYRMASVTYAIISRMLRTRFVSLPNLLADQSLVPEVLQGEVTSEKLGPLMLRALEDQAYRSHIHAEFQRLSELIRTDADQRACDAVLELLQRSGRFSAHQRGDMN